jgi:acetylornithine deacetylase/succinyl-diaminopimelate desuccinylase-like protein
MTDVFAYLQANRARFVDELMTFVRIPSVSTDPAYAADLHEAAAWIANQLSKTGPFTVQILPTERHPVVYAEWLGAVDAPTILIYGHYDVQPPDPLDRWNSPPFEPTIRNERLYGRGVSDDKGPVLIPIKVAEAFFATENRLPINIKFLLEGEEEIGSPSLEPLLKSQPDRFKADFVLSADGAMWRVDVPSITVSSRGMTGLEFRLQGPNKDLHSGRHGGAVANPLHAMARLIASLHTIDGRVAVPGFYDTVKELPAEQRAMIANLPFDEDAYCQSLNLSQAFGEPGFSTLERQWTRPTLEVNGLWGGYQGPGSKSVIPSEACAKITCRLVPDQQPDDICNKVIHHLRQNLPPGVHIEITPDVHGALPYEIPVQHLGVQTAARTLEAIYHQNPVFVRMGGTLPISEVFKRLLNMDTVFFSFSTADEDFHAPNEFFRLSRFYEGLEAWAVYWQLLSELNARR